MSVVLSVSVAIAASTGSHSPELAQPRLLSTSTGVSATAAVNMNPTTHGYWVFRTATGKPLGAAWGNASYKIQLDVSSAGAGISYGFLAISSANAGHFARVASAPASAPAHATSIVQSQAAFTGTGLKKATAAWNPTDGPTSDRFEAALALVNTGTFATLEMHTDNLASAWASFAEIDVVGAALTARTILGAGI